MISETRQLWKYSIKILHMYMYALSSNNLIELVELESVTFYDPEITLLFSET